MVCLVIDGENIPCKDILIRIITSKFKNVKSMYLNFSFKVTNVILGEKNKIIFGKDSIQDTLCNIRFNISPLSFYQINHDQTGIMYNIAKNMLNLKSVGNILDLYCGIGTIRLTMHHNVNSLLGVEIVKQAVENAIKNSKINDIKNADFICGDAFEVVNSISSDIKNIDVVIIDPPRKGCDSKLISTIMKIHPKKILYISCNPCTWTRDIKILCEQFYNLDSVVPVDLFSRTGHIETISRLIRKNLNI